MAEGHDLENLFPGKQKDPVNGLEGNSPVINLDLGKTQCPDERGRQRQRRQPGKRIKLFPNPINQDGQGT